MKDKKSTERQDPRAKAVAAMLNIAQLWRERGTPEVAREALDWEIRLQDRLKEIEHEQVAQAA